jgi:hypothetical protein
MSPELRPAEPIAPRISDVPVNSKNGRRFPLQFFKRQAWPFKEFKLSIFNVKQPYPLFLWPVSMSPSRTTARPPFGWFGHMLPDMRSNYR